MQFPQFLVVMCPSIFVILSSSLQVPTLTSHLMTVCVCMCVKKRWTANSWRETSQSRLLLQISFTKVKLFIVCPFSVNTYWDSLIFVFKVEIPLCAHTQNINLFYHVCIQICRYRAKVRRMRSPVASDFWFDSDWRILECVGLFIVWTKLDIYLLWNRCCFMWLRLV